MPSDGADKGGCHLGNQFLAGIIYRPEFGGEVAVKPGLVACPVAEFMEGRAVIVDLVRVGGLVGNADKVF